MKGLIETFSEKSLVITFFLSFIIAAIGFFKEAYLFTWGQRLVLISGLFLILKHSRFVYEHRHIRAVYLCISVIIIGFLFKIEGWPYSSILFIAGYSGIVIAYAFRFFSKQSKQALDWLKLFWVVAYFAGTLFLLESWPYTQTLVLAGLIAFLFMMAVFFYEKKEMLLKSFD